MSAGFCATDHPGLRCAPSGLRWLADIERLCQLAGSTRKDLAHHVSVAYLRANWIGHLPGEGAG